MIISSLNTDSRQYTISFTAVRKNLSYKSIKSNTAMSVGEGHYGYWWFTIACFYLSVIGDPT